MPGISGGVYILSDFRDLGFCGPCGHYFFYIQRCILANFKILRKKTDEKE